MMNDTDEHEHEHEHQHSRPSPEEVKTDLNFQLLQFGAGDFSTATQTSDVHCFDIEEDTDDSLHSLPLVEEIKMNLNSSTHLKKRWIVFGLFLLVGIPCFIGTMVAVGRKSQVPAAALATATNSRLEAAINFLSDEVSTRELLEKDGTAQNEAVKWISNIDGANLDVPSFKGSVDGPAFIQRYLLAVFYTALKGESWTANLAFLSGNPVCYWHEVFDSNLGKYTVGASCNEMSQVTSLFIPGNNLIGSLPMEIGVLTTLTKLSLFSNQITGSLPQSMQKLTDLDFLNLESNQLRGSLPTWLGELTHLRFLSLGDNHLSGSIPDEIAKMTKLNEVALDSNMLTGSLNNFHVLPNIHRLFLGENAFTGPLHTAILETNRLKELDLSTNSFNGTIPKHFFGNNRLELLDLNSNLLSGEFPVITTNTAMRFLSLYNNKLSGSLPSEVSNLKNLYHLDLSNNSLTNDYSGVFESMSSLTFLFLNHNNFDDGEVPDFSALTKLRELSLRSTNRTGVIPVDFADLTHLELLDLNNNALTGTIPEHLGNLGSLEFLFLNRNLLKGTIPASFEQLTSLRVLALDHNRLTGSASVICSHGTQSDNKFKDLKVMIADCGKNGNLTCECCGECCPVDDDNCNRGGILANLDTHLTEVGYRREEFVFSEDIVFKLK